MIEKPSLPPPPFLVRDRVSFVVLGELVRGLVFRLEHDGLAWTAVYLTDPKGAGMIRRRPEEVTPGWGAFGVDVPKPRS